MPEGTPDSRVRRPSFRTWAALALLTGVAAALRLPGLATRSLWLDEAWLANLALVPTWTGFWDEVLGRTPGSVQVAPVPPLFALALRGLALVVGRSTGGLRALPLVASVAAVPLAFLVGRRLALGMRIGRQGAPAQAVTGLAAAACCACYPVLVLYGQELKPYATDVLAVLVLVLLGERAVARGEAARPWLAFAFAAALVPGFSYPAALVLPGVALGLLVACRSPAARRGWFAAHAAAATVAIGWYAVVIGPQRARPLIAAYWQQGFPPPDHVAGWVAVQLQGLIAWLVGSPVWFFGGILGAGVLFGPPRFLVTVAGTLAVAVAAAVCRFYPLAVDRTSLYLAPVAYLALGLAAAALATGVALALRQRKILAALVFGACLAALAWPIRGAVDAGRQLNREDTAPLVAALAAERRPGDRVYVYCGAVPAFLFYGPVHGFAPEADSTIVLGAVHRDDPAGYAPELTPLLEPGARLWLLFAHAPLGRDGVSERDAILAHVRLHGKEIAAREAPGAFLYGFEIARAPGTVRHLRLSPEDLRDPARVRELLRQQGGGTVAPP